MHHELCVYARICVHIIRTHICTFMLPRQRHKVALHKPSSLSGSLSTEGASADVSPDGSGSAAVNIRHEDGKRRRQDYTPLSTEQAAHRHGWIRVRVFFCFFTANRACPSIGTSSSAAMSALRAGPPVAVQWLPPCFLPRAPWPLRRRAAAAYPPAEVGRMHSCLCRELRVASVGSRS
jgi:hypothetical protein